MHSVRLAASKARHWWKNWSSTKLFISVWFWFEVLATMFSYFSLAVIVGVRLRCLSICQITWWNVNIFYHFCVQRLQSDLFQFFFFPAIDEFIFPYFSSHGLMLYNHSDATVQHRHNLLSCRSAVGKSDLLLSRSVRRCRRKKRAGGKNGQVGVSVDYRCWRAGKKKLLTMICVMSYMLNEI